MVNVLARYQQLEQLNDDALAGRLQTDAPGLVRLALCKCPPFDARFVDQVRQIAAHANADVAQVEQVIRRAHGIDSFARASAGQTELVRLRNGQVVKIDDLSRLFDGKQARPLTDPRKAGTDQFDYSCPLLPDLENLPNERDPRIYDAILNDFAVESNPRYEGHRQGKNDTYCNIFVWDVLAAMDVDLPATEKDKNGARLWRGANEMIQFLNGEDPYRGRARATNDGWRHIDSPEEAQQLANQGLPTVVGWEDPEGIGHVAMVRPGELTAEGPVIAQAGAHNKNRVHVRDACAFSDRPVVYFAHD